MCHKKSIKSYTEIVFLSPRLCIYNLKPVVIFISDIAYFCTYLFMIQECPTTSQLPSDGRRGAWTQLHLSETLARLGGKSIKTPDCVADWMPGAPWLAAPRRAPPPPSLLICDCEWVERAAKQTKADKTYCRNGARNACTTFSTQGCVR